MYINSFLNSQTQMKNLFLPFFLIFFVFGCVSNTQILQDKKNSDEKGGYYEYDRWRISATQGLSWNAWQLDLAGGYTGTFYPKRLLTSGELLDRNGWAFDAGITREIGENWKSFFRWNHERESSNDTSFAFESNFWTIGVNWEK